MAATNSSATGTEVSNRPKAPTKSVAMTPHTSRVVSIEGWSQDELEARTYTFEGESREMRNKARCGREKTHHRAALVGGTLSRGLHVRA
jgi:hypothetical protein